MKLFQGLLPLFACITLPAPGQLATDPATGLRTGTITVNGETHLIEARTNLSGADLRGADLSRADLRRADLREANLSDATLREADLTGASLTGADLTGADLRDTIWNTPDPRIIELETQLAAAIVARDALQVDASRLTGVVNGYDIGPDVDLSEVRIASPIDAGLFHGVAIRSDGTVAAWGSNTQGQRVVPEELANVIAVSGGWFHSLALKADGTVVAWGDNRQGQSDVPPGLAGVQAVAAGLYHSLALREDGTVVGWGSNSLGSLNIPVGLSDVISISTAADYSVALKNDGTVVAWGNNSDVPPGLNDVVAISGAYDHNLALKDDGTVVAWGQNNHGQAVVPAGLSDVVAVAAGLEHSLALKGDGTLVAWGSNSFGQTTIPEGLSGAVAVSRPAADLSGADLSSHNLSGANLAGVNFSGANLAKTNFSNSNLSGADLSGTVGIDSTIFTGATLDGIVLPDGYRVISGYVVGGERPVPWSFVESLLLPLENQIAELSQRPTQASFDAVAAERDARPTQAACDAAVATARDNGQGDVTAAPENFGLTTQSAYKDVADLLDWAVVFGGLPAFSTTTGPAQVLIPPVQRDEGFAIALKFNPSAADVAHNAKRVIYELGGSYNGNGIYLVGGIPHFIAKMNGHPDKNPDSFNDLDWMGAAICVPLAADPLPAGAVAEIDLLFSLDAVRFSINGADPLTVTLDNRGQLINWSGDRTLGFGRFHSVAGGLSDLAAQSEFYQDGYTPLTGSFISGGWWNKSNASGLQFVSGGLAMQESYDAVVTERDALPTQAAYDAVVAERDARPTAEELAAAVAERDARFTEDQIRALSADYTIGLNGTGNVQMKFNLFESTDLNTFAPLTVNPDSVSVVDGSICLEFAPTDDAAFFRFRIE